MRVVLFGNGLLATWIFGLLAESDEIAAVVVHPESRAKHRDVLIQGAQRCGAKVLEAADLRTPGGLDMLKDLGAEIGVSAMFGYILRRELLELFPRGCINIHPAYLPYNRGAHPNVWPIVDGTPAGVTIHLVDEGVDTGPIYAQRKVPVMPATSAEGLYMILMTEALRLFDETWPKIQSGELTPIPQEGVGTSHKVSDLTSLDVIDLDAPTTARRVIDHLRARTFHPYPGAYFLDEDKRKIFVRVELTVEE